jgi:hypothetical protein
MRYNAIPKFYLLGQIEIGEAWYSRPAHEIESLPQATELRSRSSVKAGVVPERPREFVGRSSRVPPLHRRR